MTTGNGMASSNMFAYCLNNPVNGCDPCGTCIHRLDFWNDCERCAGKTWGEKLNIIAADIYDYATDVYDAHMMQNEWQRQVDQNSFGFAVAVGEAIAEGIDNMNEAEYQTHQAQHAFIADRFSTPEKTKNTLDGIGHAFTVAGTVAGVVSKASFAIGSVTVPLGVAITGVGTVFYIVSWMVSISMEE